MKGIFVCFDEKTVYFRASASHSYEQMLFFLFI